MTGQVEGMRVVMTGAAHGIGRATALLFAREGARLVLADLDEDGGDATAAEIRDAGGEATFVRTDVGEPAEMSALFGAVRAELGGLDSIVNIAGVLRVVDLVDTSDDDWALMFRVNVTAQMLACRLGVPMLREAGGGTIVNMASVTGVIGVPGAVAYSASKGAVIAMTKALAREEGANGIRANAVCPGWVDTGFNDPIVTVMGGRESHAALVAAAVPMGRQASAEEIAPTILFLASDASSYLTAQAIVIDGGNN
ncbi:MAG: short-chain dehydrogenase [Actinomycetia bacterium]|nr:short-chain dehydrogenase [Actinomycetes bacterium]